MRKLVTCRLVLKMWRYFFRHDEYLFYQNTKTKIQRLRTDRENFKSTIQRWNTRIEQLTRQLYALQNDEIQGVVEQYYDSREDYQSRIDSTKRLLTHYRGLKQQYEQSWQKKIILIELMLVGAKAIIDEDEGTQEAIVRPFL